MSPTDSTAPADASPPAGLAGLVARLPFGRLIKFGLVGASGVLVNYAIYIPGTRWLAMAHEWAYVAALFVSILTNFLLNEVWTFADRRHGGGGGLARRLGQFYLVSLAGAVINWGIFWIAIHRFGLLDLLAILVGIAVATAWNFVLNALWTWRRR